MTNEGAALAGGMIELDYEPFAARFRDEPERHYQRLRSEAPIYRSKAGYWVVSRHDDVQAIFREPELYSNSIVGREALSQASTAPSAELPEERGALVNLVELLATPNMVSTDPPRHTELRRIVNRAFSPNRLAKWDDYIASCTADCVVDIREDEPWDVVSRLSMPLPVSVIGRILSVGGDRIGDIKRWSDTIIETAQGDDRGTPQARARMLRMLREFSDCFVPLLEERRRAPREDMLSDLVRAEEGDTLSNLDTLTFIKSLMLAGNETTTGLIGNTIVLLLRNPQQLAKLQADPELVRNAIEESLRFRSPVQFAVRTPTADVVVHGETIRKDEPMLLLIGSANRDPAAFVDPEQFDIARPNAARHLAFGNGIHTCIGLHLARREAVAALGAILPKLDSWRLSDAPLERIESNFVYGYRNILLVPQRGPSA